MTKKDSFTFTWRIENFSMCPQKNEEKVTSPAFVVDALDKTRWELWLHPKENEDSDGKYLSCYLSRISKKEPEEITIAFNITLMNVDIKSSIRKGSKGSIFKEETTTWGYNKLASQEFLFKNKNAFLPNDVLTIQCCMWRATDEKESPAETKETMKVPASHLGTTISLEEVSSAVSDDGMTSKHYPTQCSACTRIPVEQRQISWTIKNFKAKMQSMRRISISVVSALREKSALLLSCYVSGDWNSDGSVRIDIQREDWDLKQMLVKGKVSVLDRSGMAQESREDEHLFGEDYEVWSFPPIIKLSTLENRKSALLDGGVLSLRCEFLISYNGEEVIIGGASLQISYSIEVDSLRSDISNLLIDKELTDVILISEDLLFPVHKTVLCAQSPVFRAMFNGDTQEKRTGVVRITDIDAETLKKMRSFLYGDRLPELQAEDAMKLYSAADKYQFSTLKKQCVSCLKYNLSIPNVCDVLVLADMHQDSDLMRSVHNFLHMHSQDVFGSRQWVNLMESHHELTGETMRNLLLKLTNSESKYTPSISS